MSNSSPARRWTPARQATFLEALRDTLSVSKAARRVGMSRQSAYKLRRRLVGQPFDEAWEEAVAELVLTGDVEPPSGSPRCPVCGYAPSQPATSAPARGLR